MAAALGVVFGAFVYLLLDATPGRNANDFTQIWRAGRILLDGGNPYREIPTQDARRRIVAFFGRHLGQ